MTKIINIRDNDAREALYAAGYRWALTLSRGEHIGQIVSRHRTYDAANKAAKGRELKISDLGERH
jgi:hypothetical protein